MVPVKTTILIDGETWNEFKRSVSSRYTSLRMTSLAVEEAIKCFNVVELLRSFSSAMGFVTSVHPSVREVEKRRAKLGTSAGEEIREMRNEIQAHLSGFK